MKKFLTLLLALVMALSLAACGDKTPAEPDTPDTPDDCDDAVVTVMTHAEFDAAAVDSPVTVETYIQARQGWWEKDGVGVATFYTQADDGAYFLYNMPCSKEEYDTLLGEGTKIRVSGYKAEWSGEVEIIDATCEVLEGYKVYEALDVTSLLGSDELIQHQNEKVSFKGMTVAASNDAGAPFLYNWDGSGSEGDDLYFNVALNDKTYTGVVESYLCGPGSDVYEAVKALNVGDVVDMEGFLYWYEGVNPHITSVVKAAA